MAFQPLVFSGFTIGSSSGGGSSPTIGGPVVGGTTGSVLFVGPSSTLAQDNANFNYNSSTHALTITGTLSASNVSGTNTGDVTIGSAHGLSLAGQVLSLALASTSTTGALSSVDWNTFNNKQAAGSYVTTSQIGAANGVASLDSGSKIPIAQLPSSVMIYLGNWNASTNTPTLADGTGVNGDVYRASVAGTQNLGSGSQTWVIGDLVIYDGSIWQHAPAADGVSSVNGNTGAVTVNAISQLTGDGTAGPASGSQSQAFTLATVATPGTSTKVTYNAKGLITSGTTLSSGDIPNNAANTTGTASNVTGIVAIVNGGTNSNAALTNNKVMISSSGAIVESSTTSTQLSYLDATSSIQTQLNGKQASGNYPIASSGDINETSFSAANNISSPANVTGFAFANGTVRAFDALVSVYVNATTPLYEMFKVQGIQKAASWEISTSATGDISGFAFSITNAGQIQYVDSNYSGFVSAVVKFRAITVSI